MLAVVANTWVHELRDSDSLYTEVGPKELFSHLQARCIIRHALELLGMHNKIQRYHLEVEGIPEYINMLEDSQRKAGRAGRTIIDETLLLFASTYMLTNKRFPHANDNQEDRTARNKTWSQWNTAYKRVHAKAKVKSKSNNGSVNFGAANSAARQETANAPLDDQLV